MTMPAPQAAAFGADTALPSLRKELTINEAGIDATGAGGVIVHDPLRHKFFRLPDHAARMLDWWQLGLAGPVAQSAGATLGDVQELMLFLSQSRLTVQASGGHSGLLNEFDRGDHSLAEKALHNYLFFRLPLFNPTPFLDATLPIARFLAKRMMLTVLAIIGVMGLYFTLRQWDKFVSTFFDFFSLEGLALYSTTLVGLKVLHELGHGYMARHFNCRVPVMGVAFMLLAPMLYTETSDAWRLKEKRKRLLIDAAGVLVEMAVALVALFLWAFLPDGPWRSIMYFIAATAWVMSVAVNLSPFMRFDGYHMLGDGLGMFNLGPRSFALASWKLRQVLFASGEDAPEQFRPGLRRFLLAFAYGTWVYRLSLYLGIAYTVYKMFPKAIGIPMGVIELWFFTVFPVYRELRSWSEMGWRNLFSTRRAKISALVMVGLVVLSALPINRSVSIPAVLLPAEEAWVFPPESSRVVHVAVHAGQLVQAGDVLAELASPEIEQKQRMVDLRLAVVNAKLARIAADHRDLAQSSVLLEEARALQNELEGLTRRAALLNVRAPISGIVGDMMQGAGPGTWLGRDQLLLHVVAPQGAKVSGLVNERDQARLSAGDTAVFIAENGADSGVQATLSEIGSPGAEGIENAYLSSLHGGPVAMAQEGGRAVPMLGVLPVRFSAVGAAPRMATRGTLTVGAEPMSLLSLAFGRVVLVFLRESGF